MGTLQADATLVVRANEVAQRHLDAMSNEVSDLLLAETGYTPGEFGELDPDGAEFTRVAKAVVAVHGMIGLVLRSEGSMLVTDSAAILRLIKARA